MIKRGNKVNKMNLCIIYSMNEIFTIWWLTLHYVVSFSNCTRYYFSNHSRTADCSSFVLFEKISIGQKLKWFKIWNVVFETLALFGPGGDRILLGTDTVSFSNTHCITVILTGTIFPLLLPLLKHGRYTDMLQNPIHFRRNIIIVINFSYQLRSNFSFPRVIRVGGGRIFHRIDIVIPHGELAITINSIEKIVWTAAHRI